MKLLSLLLLINTIAFAQTGESFPATPELLSQKIISLDAAAFDAYNTCDLEKFKTYFTEDLEFYHDKGGFTKTADKLMDAMRANLCSDASRKIKREAITETLEVYPLEGYGAIITGEHLFYNIINGTEQLTGRAKFTHVWLLQEGVWKMARVLSYDHREAH